MSSDGSSRRLVAGAAFAAAVLVGMWLFSRQPERTAAPIPPNTAPTPSGNTQPPLQRPPAPPAPAQPPAEPAATPASKKLPNEPGPTPGAKPPLPYRPAVFLRFSSGEPAQQAGDDFSHRNFRRILEAAAPDAVQESKLRALWKTHEDARRELWARAVPRVSGPRMLDRDQLRELDLALRTGLLGALRPDQQERLLAELPPVSSEPQPQESFEEAEKGIEPGLPRPAPPLPAPTGERPPR